MRTFFCFLWPAFGHGRLGHPQSLEYLLLLFKSAQSSEHNMDQVIRTRNKTRVKIRIKIRIKIKIRIRIRINIKIKTRTKIK